MSDKTTITSRHTKKGGSIQVKGPGSNDFFAGIVAARKPELVKHIVYIEAFLPIDGKSLLDVTGLDS